MRNGGMKVCDFATAPEPQRLRIHPAEEGLRVPPPHK